MVVLGNFTVRLELRGGGGAGFKSKTQRHKQHIDTVNNGAHARSSMAQAH